MADVKWIKITTDIFDDEKILLIESLPDAYAIITVWFKLLCLAGKQNNSGVFVLGQMPYTDKMLATIFRMKESTVAMALQTFEQFGMVEIVGGVITIPNWEKHQSLEKLEQARENTRKRVAKHREKQKLLAQNNDATQCNVTVTECNADRIDKEEDKDKEVLSNDNTKKKPTKQKFGEYQNVLLTENEYENLANSFGYDLTKKAITFLDAYIEEKGYKSKSHNLAIRRWVIDAVSKNAGNKRKEIVPNWCTDEYEDMVQTHTPVYKKKPKTAAEDKELQARVEAMKQKLSQ